MQATMGIPVGRLNDLDKRVSKLEQAGGGSITLKTNGVNNGSQTILNLKAGTNMTITDNGSGQVTFDASGGAGSGIVRSVSTISTPTTAGSSAATDYVYFVSGTTTITLPTAVGNTNRYTVKNVGSNTVTIATTSAQTIDGSSTASLPVANTSLDLVSDGSNWQVI